MSSTPYDDVFRTLLNDCSALILPVVNEVFRENYKGNEKMLFSQNEHFINQQDGAEEKRITDTCFIIQGNQSRWYHFECQSTADSSLLVRIFEYAAQIALDHGYMAGSLLEASFPHSAVLFLRHTETTPDAMKIRMNVPGDRAEYEIPVIKLQSYTLDEILEKDLLFFLPFYLFTHEKNFDRYEKDSTKLDGLKQEYAYIREQLEELCRQHAVTEYTKCTIIDMTNKVAENLAEKYGSVVKGVKEAVGGRILDYEAKRIKKEGVAEGISQGISQGISRGRQQMLADLVNDGLLTAEEAAKRLDKNAGEMEMLLRNSQ